MDRNASGLGVTLFMPHVANNLYRKSYETAKSLALVNRVEITIQIRPEMMETLNYRLENPIAESILKHIYEKNLMAVLWYTDVENVIETVLQNFVVAVAEPKEEIIEGEDNKWESILNPLILDDNQPDETDDNHSENSCSFVNDDVYEEIGDKAESINSVEIITIENEEENPHQDEKGDEENLTSENNEENVEDLETISNEMLFVDNIESKNWFLMQDDTCIVIPPVWTPINQPGNAILIYQFFRNVSSFLNIIVRLIIYLILVVPPLTLIISYIRV